MRHLQIFYATFEFRLYQKLEIQKIILYFKKIKLIFVKYC